MLNTLSELQNLNTDRYDLDDMICLSVVGEQMAAKYEALKLKTPEWLSGSLATLKLQIGIKVRDRLLKLRSELKQKEDRLKPADVRRQEVAEQLAEVEALLG